jgi:tyrosyl-tRNA synthetase
VLNDPSVPHTTWPRTQLDGGVPLPRALSEIKLCASTSAAQRDIAGGGIYLNGERVSDPKRVLSASDLRDGKYLILRKGKKSYHVIRVE